MRRNQIRCEAAVHRLRQILESRGIQKVVVHAGRMKTGSTFLQAALLHNRNALADAGWLFPESVIRYSSLQSEERVLRSSGHALLEDLSIFAAPVAAAELDALASELDGAGARSLVFSAENLGRHPGENSLAGLAGMLDGLDVTIVMYLRRPSDWIESFYAERVTGGYAREARRISSMLPELRAAADAIGFVEQCRRWSRPPRLIFRNYDLVRRSEHGLLGDFADLARLPALEPPAADAVNRSPGTAVTCAVRVFNGLTRGLRPVDFRLLYPDLLKRLTAIDPGDRRPILTASEASAVDREWFENNRGIRDGSFIDKVHYAYFDEPRSEHEEPHMHHAELCVYEEVLDFLQVAGVNGFRAEPTVAALCGQLRARLVDGMARRLRPRRRR